MDDNTNNVELSVLCVSGCKSSYRDVNAWGNDEGVGWYITVRDCVDNLTFFLGGGGDVVHAVRIRNPHENWFGKWKWRYG